MTRKAKTQDSLQAEVDRFNAAVPIGSAVEYVDHPGAPVERYLTRTEASILSGHTAVVWLEGKTGCVCVSHCTAVAGEASRSPAGATQ